MTYDNNCYLIQVYKYNTQELARLKFILTENVVYLEMRIHYACKFISN